MMANLRIKRYSAYSAGFLLALATALPAYLSSTYLAERAGASRVGVIYAGAAIAALIALSLAPRLINNFRLRSLALSGSILTAAAAFILAWSANLILILGAFVGFYVLTILLRLLTDFYLEEMSSDRATGAIRGFFLTLANLGWLVAPLAASFLLATGDYRLLYLITGWLFIPFGFLVLNPSTRLTKIKSGNLFLTLKHLFPSAVGPIVNLRRILIIDLWLNVFYALMVVYLPIYLHQQIGLDWAAIGVIFTWMLLPFVILDYPLGWLADKKWGEKEILAIGLLITGLATILVSVFKAPDILIWSIILFLTRIGAASVEIMKETYLFKKIDRADLDILSLSRHLIPLAYLIGPILAFVIISFFPLNYIFLALGLSALLLLPLVGKLTDTK